MSAGSPYLPGVARRVTERGELVRRAVRGGPLGGVAVVRAVLDEPRWLVPLALAVYVLGTTWTWEFPNWQGVPFPPVWLAAAVVALAAWVRSGRAFAPIPVTAILVVTAMLATDVTLFWSQSLRDLGLYVKAGDAWVSGAPVYSLVPLVARPDDLSNYPFLYPPVTLPLFGALSALPWPVAGGAWLLASLGAVVFGLRRIGLGWRWVLLLMAWPPVTQGLYVGNVAVPLFALFAAAVARPGLLAVPPIFKLYSGVTALWLLRREHLRDLVVAGVAVLAVCALSVATMGADLWARWVAGLQAYQVSQRLLPEFLYGFGLGRYVPLVALAALAVLVTVMALRTRDRREQLSRLGVATIVASPSLFSHGWLVALPALVRLDTLWFWLAFGITACSPGIAWFGALIVIAGSWYLPSMRKRAADDPWHPLGPAARPWPEPADTVRLPQGGDLVVAPVGAAMPAHPARGAPGAP